MAQFYEIYFFILICYFFIGCCYFPQTPEKEIIINNQSKNKIYASDTAMNGPLEPMYDTFLVNKRPFIGKQPNYIEEYSQWNDFIYEDQLQLMEKKKTDTMTFYFMEFLENPRCDITAHKISSFKVSAREILQHSINHIIYTSDSIRLYHEFNMDFSQTLNSW